MDALLDEVVGFGFRQVSLNGGRAKSGSVRRFWMAAGTTAGLDRCGEIC
jgi:hypothetical protein